MKKLFVLIAAACMTYTAAFAQTVKPFKEGERAVFLGNSITDGGHYHSYIWLYYMTRFPDMPIRVFNGGIGGDTAYDMNKRLDGDIFVMKPSNSKRIHRSRQKMKPSNGLLNIRKNRQLRIIGNLPI